MEMSGALTKVLPLQYGGILRVCFIQGKMVVKLKDSRLRGKNSSGFTNEQSPQAGAFSRDLLDQKIKISALPRAWRVVVTND